MSKQKVSILNALDALTTAANNGHIEAVHIDGGVEYIINQDKVYKILDAINKNSKDEGQIQTPNQTDEGTV